MGIVCKATDGKLGGPGAYYLPYWFLDFLHPIYSLFVMEMEHRHHHDNAMLAKRSWYDPAYWFFCETVGSCWACLGCPGWRVLKGLCAGLSLFNGMFKVHNNIF